MMLIMLICHFQHDVSSPQRTQKGSPHDQCVAARGKINMQIKATYAMF